MVSWQNFGPNATTYIIPSVVYDVLHKATCHGLSAAFGKLGAILGAQVFVYLQGAYCVGGSCSTNSPSHQVDAGVMVRVASIHIPFLLCFDVLIL